MLAGVRIQYFVGYSPMKMEEFEEKQGLVAFTQPVFIRLLLAIYHAIMSHSDLVCYVAVFMLQIRNPTLASLPLTLMVFFWGTLSIPRPTKRFWVTIIAYTEVSTESSTVTYAFATTAVMLVKPLSNRVQVMRCYYNMRLTSIEQSVCVEQCY